MALLDVRFRDPKLYQQNTFTITEAYGTFNAEWVNVAEAKAGHTVIYPQGWEKFI
jgi:hypothetical protein